MKNTLLIAVIITAIVAGGGSFYGGTQYQRSQDAATATAARAVGGGGGRGGFGGRGGAGGGFTTGSVLSKDATGITLQLRDGSSKIVFVASSTAVGMMTSGSLSDVTTGANVMVAGTPNSDGSITASSIQIRPAGMPGLFPGQGATSTTSTK